MIRGINVHRFAEGLGVQVRPPHRARRRRPPNVTHALGTLRSLIAKHGEDHASLVVMCVQASDPTALGADVISSVSIALKEHPDRFQTRREAIDWFSGQKLTDLRNRAQRLRVGSRTLACLIGDRMIDQ